MIHANTATAPEYATCQVANCTTMAAAKKPVNTITTSSSGRRSTAVMASQPTPKAQATLGTAAAMAASITIHSGRRA